MVMPLVPAATRECAQTWQTREPHPFSQEIEYTNKDGKRNIKNIKVN